jgi:hypothetical protein
MTCYGATVSLIGWRTSVGSLVVKGAKQPDICHAIIEEIGNLGDAYNHDRDPADDGTRAEAQEPSNEWRRVLP